MNIRTVFNIIILDFIALLIVFGSFVLTNKRNKGIKTYDVPLNKFEPFTKYNILKKSNIDFKIQNDLPKIEAASAFYPFTANLVQNIYSKESYSKDLFNIVSTNEAFYDVINGKTDIAIVTGPSDEQKELINNSNKELIFELIYEEPLVVFVNRDNKINNLNIEQIQDIYNNNSLSWNTYQLEENNGSQTCFESIVKDNIIMNNHYEIKTMPEIIDEVAKNKNGIGYAFGSYYTKMHINNNTKLINVNNKGPNQTDYPLLFPVYMVYKIDNNNINIQKIAKWLQTNEGQDFIESIK